MGSFGFFAAKRPQLPFLQDYAQARPLSTDLMGTPYRSFS
jgi:hypothetical protein